MSNYELIVFVFMLQKLQYFLCLTKHTYACKIQGKRTESISSCYTYTAGWFRFLLNIHYRNSFFYWLVWSWHELVTIFILGYRMLTVKRTEMEDLENVILYIYMNLLHRTHILKKKIFFHVVASKLQYFLRIEDIRWIVKRVPAKGK